MNTIRNHNSRAFTLVELAIGVVAGLIVILAVALTLGDASSAWVSNYNVVNAGVVSDGYVVQKAFDHEVRSASYTKLPVCNTNLNTGYVKVYRDDPTTGVINGYSKFYLGNTTLILEKGTVSGSTETSTGTQNICTDVNSASFNVNGRSAQMILNLTLNGKTETTVTSAYLNN
jgi:hypothetical protein